MSTRTKKQKIADEDDDDEQSPLALLFTEQWRDIFEKHILPKLRPKSELKFLKMAFKNARDAVERSKIKVGTRFDIREFTSISQMEFAWDNYHWGVGWYSTQEGFCYKVENGYEGTQDWFCQRVASMNKLEYLVWAREVKNCDWDSETIYRAAEQGNLLMVKYCVENGCPMNGCAMDEDACYHAAEKGHLDVLKYLHENDCPWEWSACQRAHENNHVDCLSYLIEQKCPKWEKFDSTHADYDPDYDGSDHFHHYDSDYDEEEDDE